jgi:hypothetical protein
MKKDRTEPERPNRDENFEAYCRALPELLKTDVGLFVAFSRGRLIDKDVHELALVKRVTREHPGTRALIQRSRKLAWCSRCGHIGVFPYRGVKQKAENEDCLRRAS